MVTTKEYKDGWTNIRISLITQKKLKILKAQYDYINFDELISDALDIFEETNENKKRREKNEQK